MYLCEMFSRDDERVGAWILTWSALVSDGGTQEQVLIRHVA